MDENRLKFIVSFCFLNTVAKLTFNRRLGDQTLPYGNPRWDPKGLQYIFVGFFSHGRPENGSGPLRVTGGCAERRLLKGAKCKLAQANS